MKRIPKEWRLVIVLAVAAAALVLVSPSRAEVAGRTFTVYVREMVLILPPVFLLIGILDAWVPRPVVEKYLGRNSGIVGVAISGVLGAVAAGPMYVAFPLAAAMLAKGTRMLNVIVFLSMWAAGKVPMVTLEANFMGLNFALVRLMLTIAAAPIIGWVVEQVAPVLQPSAVAAGENADGGGAAASS
ncbi:MAG: permease [Firmicutes bacterium]|jgi:uncharacterized membrane protein YraQ (UPF0718 family)|nr:permease [Bacillota bacterium]